MIARLNLGGPARCVIHLATGLEKLGFETVVAAGTPAKDEGDLSADLVASGVVLERIPGLKRDLNPLSDLKALHALKKTIQAYKPDIIHTHTSKAGFLGRMASKAARPRPIRVHTYHGHVLDGYFGPLRTDFFRRMERSLARITDALVAVSPSVRDELLYRHQVGEPDQYCVIPSGFPDLSLEGVEGLRDALGFGTSPVAGMIGRLVPIKGHDLLLKAAPALRKRVPDIRFLIVGDGPLRPKLEAFAAQPEWKGSFRVLGARRDMERILKTLDLLLLPSLKEGLPTVLLEAVAAKVPIAASRIPGVLDLFRDGENALLFEPGSVAGFLEAVARLAADPGLRRELADAAGREIPDKVPDYRGVAEAHARLYRRLMEQ